MCQSQYGLSARYSDAIFTSHVIHSEPSQLNLSNLNPRPTVGFEFICATTIVLYIVYLIAIMVILDA